MEVSDNMAGFMINGTEIPDPETDGYVIDRNDIDSSATGRTESGYMYREVVRTGVYKISMQFHVTAEECRLIENLLSSPNFTLRFLDRGIWSEKTMYCSSNSSQCLSVMGDEMWILSCSCQEV